MNTQAKINFLGVNLDANLSHRIATAAFFVLFGISFSCFASRIADIKFALNLSDAEFGTVLLCSSFGQFCTMFFSSYLIAKFGSKNTLTAGVILNALALLYIGVAPNAWQLRLALFLSGVGGNFCNIAMNAQAVGVEKLYGRSIMGSFHGFWSGAACIGGVASIGIVALGFTPIQHFFIATISAILALTFMRPYLLKTDVKPEEDEQELANSKKKKPPRYTKYIVLLGFIAFCCMATEGAMFDWSVVYFRDVLNAPTNFLRFGFVAFMSMMALGRFSSDKLIMKFGIIAVLKASGILIATGLLLAVLIPSIPTTTLGFAFVGFGVSSIVPLCYSLAGKSRRIPVGKALTGVSSIGFFGFFLGPPIIGYISEFSSLRWSYSLIALVGLTVTFLAPSLKARVDEDSTAGAKK